MRNRTVRHCRELIIEYGIASCFCVVCERVQIHIDRDYKPVVAVVLGCDGHFRALRRYEELLDQVIASQVGTFNGDVEVSGSCLVSFVLTALPRELQRVIKEVLLVHDERSWLTLAWIKANQLL